MYDPNGEDSIYAEVWAKMSNKAKVSMMKRMGFGDYRVYAKYKWMDFQPHTRNDIATEMLTPLPRT